MDTLNAILGQLTYDDLDQWAGEAIRTRGKGYVQRVEELHRTANNELVAWVQGTEKYATLVHLDPSGMHGWLCTCPYDQGPCKHAAAVILAAARSVHDTGELPMLDEDSELGHILMGDQDRKLKKEPNEDAADRADPGGTVKRAGPSKVRKILAGKSWEELHDLLVTLAREFPAVERRLLEADQLSRGQIGPLVRSLHKEIRRLTDEPAWRNQWSDEASLPDYSHVRQQFRALFDAGHADELLDLGNTLWRLGTEQIEQSDDEGETMGALSACLEIVLQAVPKSSLKRADQLLWVIERMLADEFSLLDSGEEILADPAYTVTDWQAAAAVLEERLQGLDRPKTVHFADTYRRNRLIGWLIKAYERGGQAEKVLPLLEQEADVSRNYEQLVDRLVLAGKREQARQWCVRGFDRTVTEAPGIAACLQKRLREMAAADRQDSLVAAYRAQDFFGHASLETYRELRKAAEKIGVWPKLRELALAYLQTGQRPDRGEKLDNLPPWPLPDPEVAYPAGKEGGRPFPDRQTLIDIAIAEKRYDDVMRLYQAMKKGSRTHWFVGEKVAKAVFRTHPEVALAIWRENVDRLIAEVKPRAYVEAGGFLRLMRKVYEAGNRLDEWRALLAELRRTHKAKRRLLEVLDGVSGGSKKLVG